MPASRLAVHVKRLVEKVTWSQVFLRVLWFSSVSILPPMLHTHLHRHVVITRTNGQAWEPSKTKIFRKWASSGYNEVLSHLWAYKSWIMYKHHILLPDIQTVALLLQYDNVPLTLWSRILLVKLTGPQLARKFPALYGTRRFIAPFTTAGHVSLSWALSIQFMPHPTSWRSVLILFSRLRLGFPSGLFLSGFTTKILYAPLSFLTRATCSTHLILDMIRTVIFGEGYRPLSSPSCSLPRSRVTSSLLGPNILLSTLFQNTLSLRSCRKANEQVSHPYKTTGKTIFLYTLIFTF